MTRLVAITSGGDWSDANVDHLYVPFEMNLAFEHHEFYSRDRSLDASILFKLGRHDHATLNFRDWLLYRGAEEADIEEYYEQ